MWTEGVLQCARSLGMRYLRGLGEHPMADPHGGSHDGPVDPRGPGRAAVPSGRLVRGRGVRRPLPDTQLPELGIYLLGRRPPAPPWESRWLQWPDFLLPLDKTEARLTLQRAWWRAATERVEIACGGGRGPAREITS